MSNHGWHTEVIDLSDIYLAVTKQGLICRAFAMKINQLCWNKSYTLAQTAFGQPAVNLFVFCEGFSFLFLLRKFEYFMRISQNVIKNKSFALKKIELESKMTLSSFFFFWSFFAVMLAQCYIAAEQAECSLQYQPNPSISKSSK